VTADEHGYLGRLQEICSRERVAMVCFGSEIEMRRVALHRDELQRQTGARLIVNDAETVEAFIDKWTTVQLLRRHGLPAPDSVLTTDPDAVASFLRRQPFPVVVKPRWGSGSRGVTVVRDRVELDLLAGRDPEKVVQEYLHPDDQEYTVGAYQSRRHGYTGQIVLRRTLAAGLTYKAEVVHDEAIETACRQVVEAFPIWGPINLQLRKTDAGVRIFEINLRFSSTAAIRAHFGFNDADMCLRDEVLGEELPRPEVRPGVVLRYWDELYLGPDEVARASSPTPPEGPRGTRADDF
jgi:carbamoyl-phosphate synthase large subunit